MLKKEIDDFLTVSDGHCESPDDGAGYLHGNGHGSGHGEGSGNGYGFGDCNGCGIDSGEGPGSAYSNKDPWLRRYGTIFDSDGFADSNGLGIGYFNDITSFNGRHVHFIDMLPTIIESVHGNYAKGYVLQSELTLKPCYIAKIDDCFAHGDTLKDAFEDAAEKAMQRKPVEDRIREFRNEYPDNDKKIPAKELYKWHGILTCSCRTGRNTFIHDHGIDIDNDEFTVKEFIELTKNEYGSEVIEELEKSLK